MLEYFKRGIKKREKSVMFMLLWRRVWYDEVHDAETLSSVPAHLRHGS